VVSSHQGREYGEREVALLQTFADQAVIAIENARLFNELQDRNRETIEALRREHTTGEILRQISRAPDDVGVTLAAIGEAIRTTVGAEATGWWFSSEVGLTRVEGGADPSYLLSLVLPDEQKQLPGVAWEDATWLAEAARTGRPFVVADTSVLTEQENPPIVQSLAREVGTSCSAYWTPATRSLKRSPGLRLSSSSPSRIRRR
jgi:GAF domain-containing protein